MRLFNSIALLWVCGVTAYAEEQSCSAVYSERDPNLVEKTINFGELLGGEYTVDVFIPPNVTTFYQLEKPPASTAVTPKHNGFSAKFINLSNKDLQIYWDPEGGRKGSPMWRAKPFSCGGTASFPTHKFYYTLSNDESNIIKRFEVGNYPNNVYVYDPFTVEGDDEATKENLKVLTAEEVELYKVLRRTVIFNNHYLEWTGRSYLVNFPRQPTKHFMWPADYFGQTHWATTRETHFVDLPPELNDGEDSDPIKTMGRNRVLEETDPRLLAEYREPDKEIMNMTLKVISCSPRAFEIKNFLSRVEVAHILNIAAGIDLQLSGVGMEHYENEPDREHRTRTSYNSWLDRERTPVIDAIFRRAADVTRIDEALLRKRDKSERPDWPGSASIAESLQLVHYDKTQEYTAHHDFGFNDASSEDQPQRYLTLLLYLNEGMVGGETSFPRWVNAETFKALKVTPEVGKAVLFYSQLPDGNMDDFSHHAALPVEKGEKWLTNLWIWDPTFKE